MYKKTSYITGLLHKLDDLLPKDRKMLYDYSPNNFIINTIVAMNDKVASVYYTSCRCYLNIRDNT